MIGAVDTKGLPCAAVSVLIVNEHGESVDFGHVDGHQWSPSRGGRRRLGEPDGGSAFTTSAPRSDRSRPHSSPRSTARSITRRPARGRTGTAQMLRRAGREWKGGGTAGFLSRECRYTANGCSENRRGLRARPAREQPGAGRPEAGEVWERRWTREAPGLGPGASRFWVGFTPGVGVPALLGGQPEVGGGSYRSAGTALSSKSSFTSKTELPILVLYWRTRSSALSALSS